MAEISHDAASVPEPVQVTRWIDDYMPIPFRDRGRSRAGLDCFGLCRLILAERAGIALPLFDVVDVSNGRSISGAIEDEAATWLPVMIGQERQFDFVVMRGAITTSNGGAIAGEFHLGMVTQTGWLIHTEENVGVMHVAFSHPSVRDRIKRIYRHRGLA